MKCIYCKCTDEQACPGGCYWISVNPPVCSQCESVHAAAEVTITETEPELCPESTVPAPHALVWTSSETCHCARCKQRFVA